MENFFTRYKNPLVLIAVLVIQVIGLATQVKRPDPARGGSTGGPRLIRVWTVSAFAPLESALVATGHFLGNAWRNYVDLHDVRRQNRELQEQIDRMRLEQVRLRNEAEQSRRLQTLLDFKERYVGQTLAAQVIATSGSDLSHVITIDKGYKAGVKQDMAVITPDGIVGKVKESQAFSAQILLINDRESGAGVILENSRLRGVLHGAGLGELRVGDVMSDEKVDVGERVITSGGDRVYPKGFPVGTVTAVGPDPDANPFLSIAVKPAADLNRLEEVLVVTAIAETAPATAGLEAPHRAADVLAQRLPSIPKKAEESGATDVAGTASSPTGAAKKQPAPQKTGGGANQPPDQAEQAPKKPAGPGAVKTVGTETQANPNRPQPRPGDAEKPPR